MTRKTMTAQAMRLSAASAAFLLGAGFASAQSAPTAGNVSAAGLTSVGAVLEQARADANGASAVRPQALYYDPGFPPGAAPPQPVAVNCSVYENIAPADLVSILRSQPGLLQMCPQLANSIPPADLGDILKNAPPVVIAPGTAYPGFPPVPPGSGVPAYELPVCPPNAMEAFSADPALGMQYIGYRFMRSDGGTCSPWPSPAIYFQDLTRQNVDVNGAADSFQARLNSPTYTVRWNFYSQAVSDPFYSQPPYNGYRFYYVQDREYTGSSRRGSVAVQIQARAQHPLYPWQDETFQFSFDGYNLQANVADGAAYQYTFQTAAQQDSNGVSFQVTAIPGARLLTAPDGAGISATLAKTADGKSFQILLNDRWAAYYPGQRFELSYQLKRDRFFGIADVLIYQGDATLAAAPQSTIDLSGRQLKEALKPGSGYVVFFQFRRLGATVSTDGWTNQQNSAKTQF